MSDVGYFPVTGHSEVFYSSCTTTIFQREHFLFIKDQDVIHFSI